MSIGYIREENAVEALDTVKPLWEQLRYHHRQRGHRFAAEIANKHFAERKVEWMNKASSGSLFLLIARDETSGADIGYVIASVNEAGQGEIDSIFIKDGHRGLGVGGTFMKEALAWLESKEAVTIEISVMYGNEEALPFYEKFGFAPRTYMLRRPLTGGIALPEADKAKQLITIEEAEEEDLPDILELQKQAFRSQAELYRNHSIQPMVQTLPELRAEHRGTTILKAVFEGCIVGSVRAYIQGDTCYIGKLIVHPHGENQGLGTRLMQEIEGRFSEQSRFELFTGSKSEKNLYLYEKLGYVPYKSIDTGEGYEMIFLEKVVNDKL